MATPIVLQPKEQSQVVIQGNASKTPIVIGGNQQSGGTGGGGNGECALVADFFEIIPDTSEEAMTDEEITQELEDIFNTIFN